MDTNSILLLNILKDKTESNEKIDNNLNPAFLKINDTLKNYKVIHHNSKQYMFK